MDSKRKANGNNAALEELDDRAAKRRKLPDIDLSKGETPESTTQYGLTFVEQVKRTQDKSGRPVATNFLSLPSKRDLPEYYKVIKMPIAIDTVEAKLTNREFPNLTSLESYCKRMIANAKEFNQKGSEIYDDAERIRKALSNFMTKHNPAYKTPGYVAFPTPIPDDARNSETDAEGEPEDAEEDAEGDAEEEVMVAAPVKRKPGRPPKNPAAHHLAQQQRSSTTPARSESQFSSVGYSGLTFQQAQEKLISDLLGHQDQEDDEYATFEPFVHLPSRNLKDYYQVIPHPVSLKGVQKLIRGVHGRGDATGISDFKTWKALEDEMSYIWKNAWHYNEDGSEISLLAKDLETAFYKALAEAKKAVPEPSQPKLKLKMSAPEPTPRITLRMGGKASPAESPAPQSGSNEENEPSQNGASTRRSMVGGASGPVPNLIQLDRARSMSNSVDSPTTSTAAMIKNEEGSKLSPSIPPAGANHRSGSLTTNSYVNGNSMLPPTSGIPSPANYYPGTSGGQPYNVQSTYHLPNPASDLKWRQPGKNASDAMITNLSLATHPGLNISRHFRMDLPPSPTLAHQSITINLPQTHYYLQIKPTIAASLLDRQHRLFVTSGNQRLNPMPAIPGLSIDQRHPLFEARLLPGVNRIEVELIAALPKGASKPPGGPDTENEKISIFAHLLRS